MDKNTSKDGFERQERLQERLVARMGVVRGALRVAVAAVIVVALLVPAVRAIMMCQYLDSGCTNEYNCFEIKEGVCTSYESGNSRYGAMTIELECSNNQVDMITIIRKS